MRNIRIDFQRKSNVMNNILHAYVCYKKYGERGKILKNKTVEFTFNFTHEHKHGPVKLYFNKKT